MQKRIADVILENLKCPKCGETFELSEGEKSLVCQTSGGKRHCFDISSDGYVNFALADNTSGDTKDAVRARTAFLDSGAFERISDTLTELTLKYAQGGFVIDAGCGEGYYSTRIAERGAFVFGADISKNAVAHCAKRAKRGSLGGAFFAVASVFSLPVRDASADAVVNVFAPCAETEYSRVLKDGGALIMVQAAPDHLMGLKERLYENVYKNEERADIPVGMTLKEEIRLTYDLSLDSNELIMALFSMTPYYWRTSLKDKEKLVGLEKLDTKIDILFSVYQK
ncbi:MAG: methyltransferase domain-containing protein [Clostridia bacterium]|nr:methyltransferase domain-containing protein [Clostridia bacterium]